MSVTKKFVKREGGSHKKKFKSRTMEEKKKKVGNTKHKSVWLHGNNTREWNTCVSPAKSSHKSSFRHLSRPDRDRSAPIVLIRWKALAASHSWFDPRHKLAARYQQTTKVTDLKFFLLPLFATPHHSRSLTHSLTHNHTKCLENPHKSSVHLENNFELRSFDFRKKAVN